MWGTPPQPTSYPSGYGFTPSTVVSAAYTGCTTCVVTPTLSPAGGTASSVTLSTTTPGAGIWYTTDGSNPATSMPAGGVPSGTSSSYTPMCQPIAQPATSALKNITAYGATTSASDNSAAIQNACAAAGTAQSGGPLGNSGIYIPAGTFNHTAQLTLNCNVYGQGPTSELYCPNPTIGGTNCEILTNGSNQVWSQWKHYVNSPSGNDSTNWNLFINGGSNNRTDTLFLYGGNAGGIINQGTTNEIDTNNGIFFTKRDANYHADGTVLNSTVDHTYVYGSGDDSDSNVTYSGTDYVDGSLVQWNTFTNNTCPDCARGMSVPGGRNMTFQDNLVQNIYDAGMYIAQESGSFTENPVSNIIVRYNFFNDTMTDVSTGHAAIFFWSSISGSGGISNVDILGNIIAGTGSGAAALETQNCSGCTLNNVSFTNNTVTGSTGMWSSTGTSSNISCSGNTYNGSPSNSGAAGSANVLARILPPPPAHL